NLPAAGGGEAIVASLVAGLREVRSQPVIRTVLIITIIMNSLMFPYQQMLPVFARDVLRVGPELLGLLVAADGVGALTGALLVGSLRGTDPHGQVFAGGSLLAATLVIVFALSPWFLLSLPLQLV